MSKWTLFSNHGHVLLFLAQDPEVRLRDVAASVGITERAVQKIVRDLQDARMLTVTKHGRRNRYRIHLERNLRHDLESHCTVGQLVELVERGQDGEEPPPESAAPPPAVPTEPAGEPAPEAATEPRRESDSRVEPEVPSDGPEPAATEKIEPAGDAGEQGSLF